MFGILPNRELPQEYHKYLKAKIYTIMRASTLQIVEKCVLFLQSP